jgi:hypothetical protein
MEDLVHVDAPAADVTNEVGDLGRRGDNGHCGSGAAVVVATAARESRGHESEGEEEKRELAERAIQHNASA